MPEKVYYKEPAQDVLITNEIARLGPGATTYWVRDLAKAEVQTVFNIRWDLVVPAALGGLLMEACVITSGDSGIAAFLVFLLWLAGGLLMAFVCATGYRVRIRTRRWRFYHALESADKARTQKVVSALNEAIKEYHKAYGLF